MNQALLLLSIALASGTANATVNDSAPRVELIGMRAVDVDGQVHKLGLDEGLAPVALVFLDTGCPISNRYAPRLEELAREAHAQDVAFYVVLSDPMLTSSDARSYRDERKLSCPVLFDASGELAHRLDPTHVPEAFVVTTDDRVVYRGRIDDRYSARGKLRASITSHDLAEAIRSAGDEAAEYSRTEVIGCIFEAWHEEGVEGEVTYNRQIEPILRANCVECHRPEDIAPFPLETYAQARRRARMLALVAEDRSMPPWHAVPGVGAFRDERTLGEREIAALEAWAEAGAPEGDPQDRLPAPVNEADARWRLGEPDYIVEMPVDYDVPADGEDIYRYFVIPSELVEDQTVVAVDFRPGDASVVHHAIMYQDHTGWGRGMDAAIEGPGFGVFGKYEDSGSLDEKMLEMATISGWAPGAEAYQYPPGLGMRLNRGGEFLLEIHYHLSGKATTDRSSLGLYFAKEPVERFVEGLVIGTEDIDIPPGEASYRRHVWMKVPTDLDLIDISPHMHYLGTTVEATLTRPDGTTEELLRIDDWDFRWQGAYVYRTPVRIPKGSRIDATFHFDNSAANPSNPSSPPARVQEGWQTTDEMCLLYLSVVPDNPASMEAVNWAMLASFLRPGDS